MASPHSPENLKARQAKLAALLPELQLDVLALNAGPSLSYFTGLPFHLMERPAVALFSADKAPALVLPELEMGKTRGLAYPLEIVGPLLDPDKLVDALADFPVAMARQFHACTHMTIAPTVAHGGTKTNVIPDRVDLQLDIRTLPGQSLRDVEAMLDEALGDLADRVELVAAHDDPSTESPVETALWDTLGRTTQAFYGGSRLVPMICVGATDARFFRRLGATAYGFGLFSQKLTFEDYGRELDGTPEAALAAPDSERPDVGSDLVSPVSPRWPEPRPCSSWAAASSPTGCRGCTTGPSTSWPGAASWGAWVRCSRTRPSASWPAR